MAEIQLTIKVGDEGRTIEYAVDTDLSVTELKSLVTLAIREGMEKHKKIYNYRKGRIDE